MEELKKHSATAGNWTNHCFDNQVTSPDAIRFHAMYGVIKKHLVIFLIEEKLIKYQLLSHIHDQEISMVEWLILLLYVYAVLCLNLDCSVWCSQVN